MSHNFISHFSSIEDPRQSNKQHQLMDILFLSICAVLSGAEGWEDIEDFGHAKLHWLKQYLPFDKGIPRHDTIAIAARRKYTPHAPFTLSRAIYYIKQTPQLRACSTPR
jgi:predicted transposase YbfD/YdcC